MRTMCSIIATLAVDRALAPRFPASANSTLVYSSSICLPTVSFPFVTAYKKKKLISSLQAAYASLQR